MSPNAPQRGNGRIRARTGAHRPGGNLAVVRRRIAVVFSVAAVVAATVAFSGLGAGAQGRATGASAASTITFSSPAIVDTVHTYGEPDVRVDPSNTSRMYASGPWGTGTQR